MDDPMDPADDDPPDDNGAFQGGCSVGGPGSDGSSVAWLLLGLFGIVLRRCGARRS